MTTSVLPPPRENRLRVWIGGLIVFLILLWLLRSIALPFVAGMAVAYLLDPIADRLERGGMSRAMATLLLCIIFFLTVPIILALLAPVIGDQISGFVKRVPDYGQSLMNRAQPVWDAGQKYLSKEQVEELRATFTGYAGTAAQWVGTVLGQVVSGSLVLVDIVSLLFITPIVAFYMLRDWDRITAQFDSWLPRRHADTIRAQLHAIDVILSGYVRGQSLVSLTLSVFYGIGLAFSGLELGLIVGLVSGLLTFIPFLGTIMGLFLCLVMALAQGATWALLAKVGAVFVVGHILEGYVLTPRLIGDKIGLHPLWVIFALLAGGALFGLVGILLSLPAAAVIGVLMRFGLGRYLASSFYSGGPAEPDAK